MKVICVVGARPNFMKIAPLMKEFKRRNKFEPILVHTGQHYDLEMSQSFFQELSIPMPDINLEVGSGSHAVQTARILESFERILIKENPHMVIVVGDVNSTMACTVCAKKLLIPVAHVEAGLRSGDMTMPEEINRLVTDVLADILFATSDYAVENLRKEGVSDDRVHLVGNIMIDTLVDNLEAAKALDTFTSFGLERSAYALLTMHRPSNTDNPDVLRGLVETFREIGEHLPIIFPVHPRTRKQLTSHGLLDHMVFLDQEVNGSVSAKELSGRIIGSPPLKYRELLNLNVNARFVITDSGGLQEETTFCGVPCITIRDNTERPETVSEGTNTVVGNQREHIIRQVQSIMSGTYKKGSVPHLWDGHTARRIVDILAEATCDVSGRSEN